ncbi:MAG: Y-family DNA polymerase [Aureliella sp.]
MSKRLLCIWLPNWPIQRIQAEEPTLASEPLLLTMRDARRGLIVAAANLPARAAGVKPTMRLSEAQVLVDAEVREHEADEDIERLCHLAEQAQQFSPIVGLETLDKKRWFGRHLHQPESLLLDITGIPSLYGGELQLLNAVGQWLYQCRYFGCLGTAGTIGAAWAVANYGLRKETDQNTCSINADETQVSTELNCTEPTPLAPNDDAIADEDPESLAPPVPVSRFRIVPQGADAREVGLLSVSALRQPEGTIESLRRLGLRRISELASLPREGMATRLGENLMTRWDQATGVKHEPLVSLHSLPDWCLEQSLEFPTSDRDTIEELLRQNCSELSKRLAKRGHGAIRVVCRLDLVEAQPLVLQLSLFRPANDADHLELLLLGQFEQVLRTMSEHPLWRLSLQATMTAPMIWRQADLFAGNEASHRNEMARLVDTLSNRLGRKRVLGARPRRDAQPEMSYTLRPLTGIKKDGTQSDTVKKISSRFARQSVEPKADDPQRRPSHLLENPKEIEPGFKREKDEDVVRGLARCPDFIKVLGKQHRVDQSIGPERLESGWWRGPSARRDYYRVETHLGSRYWIYRDLNSGQWFLHGQFD